MSTLAQQWKEEGKEVGLVEGKEVGLVEGEKMNKLRVALNCLKKGMTIDLIAEITELPIDQVRLLKANL